MTDLWHILCYSHIHSDSVDLMFFWFCYELVVFFYEIFFPHSQITPEYCSLQVDRHIVLHWIFYESIGTFTSIFIFSFKILARSSYILSNWRSPFWYLRISDWPTEHIIRIFYWWKELPPSECVWWNFSQSFHHHLFLWLKFLVRKYF